MFTNYFKILKTYHIVSIWKKHINLYFKYKFWFFYAFLNISNIFRFFFKLYRLFFLLLENSIEIFRICILNTKSKFYNNNLF